MNAIIYSRAVQSLLLLFITWQCAVSQTPTRFLMHKHSDDISFVVMDTVHGAQSTVIEYPDCLVLIEVPMIDEGGGKQTHLDEDAVRAAQYREFLYATFNRKPIRYIMSSHWHQHSLSGVTPFTETGTQIITTAMNWNYAIENDLLKSESIAATRKQVRFIDKDTTLLADSRSPIRVLYIDSSYNHKPTKDYLFFYLTKQSYLHASCMAAVSSDDFTRTDTVVYSGRLIDFRRAIEQRNLPVRKVIRLGREDQSGNTFRPGIYDYTDITTFMAKGKNPDELLDPYRKLSVWQLECRTDSIMMRLHAERISPSAINGMVYDCIGSKEYDKAVLLARLLNLYYPGELDFIDTLGEAYYFKGDVTLAKRISAIIFSRKPDFTSGISAWEKNKANLGR